MLKMLPSHQATNQMAYRYKRLSITAIGLNVKPMNCALNHTSPPGIETREPREPSRSAGPNPSSPTGRRRMKLRLTNKDDIPAMVELGRGVHAESCFIALPHDDVKLARSMEDLLDRHACGTKCFLLVAIGRTDRTNRFLQRLGFMQTGGNYAVSLG